jgi:hypothetical protein
VSVTARDQAQPAVAPELDRAPRLRRRRSAIAALIAVLAAAVAGVVLAGPFGGAGNARSGVADNGYPTALARVRRRSLDSRTAISGTLGYAGSYSVVNQAVGAATWLPSAGQVIRQGQVVYRVAGLPVVLLYGQTPAYRTLKLGMTGPDVAQLNANLVALGYADSSALDASSDTFSAATKYGLEQLQAALGVRETGALRLGQAVFLPRALRITQVMATLGTTAAPGGVIAQASSVTRQVIVNLDAAQQSSVRAGDRVLITLPDNSTTAGVVSAVGKVAISGSSGTPTVPIYIAPRDPSATGNLDKAPVQVQITTATVKHVLVVPVDALLALAGGGVAVEAVRANGVHHLVPVTPGLFDDSDGLVQVSGSGLFAGERVVIPSS